MRKSAIVLLLTLLPGIVAFAQKQTKPWTDWNQKEAQKMLDDSPWGRTQIDTDTSEMVYTPTAAGNAANSDRAAQGATNQATSIKFRIRFFTARPIRQALVRILEENNQLDKAKAENLHQWANLHTDEYIVVAVSYEGTDRRYLGRVSQAFESAVTAILKDKTYLERRDGKRLFLTEYKPPQKDGFGAHFIFPRALDGQPFINTDSGSIRFHSEYENKTALDTALNPAGQTSRGVAPQNKNAIQPESQYKFKLDMRFKVADMTYDGVLEY
jgi:hypothetical protein